jgi:hypothetical protein
MKNEMGAVVSQALKDILLQSVSAVESKPASDGRIKTGHFFE